MTVTTSSASYRFSGSPWPRFGSEATVFASCLRPVTECGVSNDHGEEAAQVTADLPPPVPAMPSVARHELYAGTPYLLAGSSLRHNLGWQDHRKAGPSFVVTRLSRVGAIKVVERFPLTEQGWAGAWRALSDLDTSAATAVAAPLAGREAGRRAAQALAALDGESLRCLGPMAFNGGSGEVPLAQGQAYDVRFLGDRIMVTLPRSVNPLVEVPYQDVETVEVSGSSPRRSPGELLALASGVALLGALLGWLVLGLLGLFLGALIFGLIAAMVGGASTRIESIVRIRATETELYFLDNQKRPEALRIELSEPLRAIGKTHGAQDEAAATASESISDQLSKLASLLQEGLITRAEFEHLKAKLIAES